MRPGPSSTSTSCQVLFLLARPDGTRTHLVDHQLRDQHPVIVAGLPRATVRPQPRDRTHPRAAGEHPHQARQLRRRARARPRQRQPHLFPTISTNRKLEMPTGVRTAAPPPQRHPLAQQPQVRRVEVDRLQQPVLRLGGYPPAQHCNGIQ